MTEQPQLDPNTEVPLTLKAWQLHVLLQLVNNNPPSPLSAANALAVALQVPLADAAKDKKA